MSSDEEVDLDVSSTSDSEPSSAFEDAKPAKGKGKAKTTKAVAKPKATTTKKATTKKAVKESDEEEEDEIEDENEAGPSSVAAKTTKKSASETYKKVSQLEHILLRPDSYIGSVETIKQTMWTYDSEEKRMVYRDVKYVPGFFKIIDEILVNAADNKINDPTMDTIKVNIDIENSTISVFNNGRGIPIEMHSKEKMFIPELIFGHLLSSSNYDDDEKKLTGGRNGYGAKLANIYSHEFTVDTADKKTKQKYKQTWTDNMSKCGKAKITSNGKGEEYTRVTFRPDLKRFGMERIDDDTASLLKKRVHDLAGTVKDIKVFLNDERLKVKGFKQYVEMYLSSAAAAAADASGGAAQSKQSIIYEQIGKRWEVAFAVSEGSFQQVSFANSIATTKGGSHVNTIADQISKNLITAIAKKNKAATVKPAQIKNHMWIFVNALIENPTFDSQTKETLTLTASKFGTKPTLSEEFMKKVQKSAIIDHVLNWAKFKADQQIKKTDGAKRNRLSGLPKLADANNAGTKNANKCTLILTEGDSAKALAVAGLGVVGRDFFGVFPLRGKLLNVREAKHEQIMKNEEIQNIKKIMGLQHNKEYSNISSLRYGQLMIMTDQDHDGSHIKGLLINFLDHFYPSLLKVPNFLVEFVTPIVRVTKGKQRRDFFTIPEYEQWLEETPDARKWESKYYKGLGTSKDSDARDYFSNMEKHMIPFSTTREGDRDLIDLAFSKKKADDRKEWLRQFKPGTYLNHDIDEIPYDDFINKELILFSMADNIRSIPSVVDGLKPGQRKVIWGCFKRKLKKEIKVAQLVGYISEHAAYHHGEASLTSTIVNLAQDFVGSNNLNLLAPNGQYGTRDQGGKDSASARYIFTEPSPIARTIYHPLDDPLLNNLKDDNQTIEPEWYIPILPMVLVNGAEGIGTGWSTNIPCYNPVDIVDNIRRLMEGKELEPMLPWWRGFKGNIKKVNEHKYDVTGIAKRTNDTTVEITELPIHLWTQNYKVTLEGMIGEKGDGVIKDYKEHHDNRNVHFVVNMSAKDVEKNEERGLVEFFKLTSKVNTSNMICFDFDGKIKKYDSPEEIIEEFYPKRLEFYQRRKDHLAAELENAFDKLTNQARFVQMIIDKQLSVSNRKKADVVAELKKKEFRPFPKVAKAKAAGETEEVVEEDEDEEKVGASSDYDYLLGMPIMSLTREKIEKLRQQAADKEVELLNLLEKKPVDLWNTDLDNFLEEWEKSCKEWEVQAILDSNGKPTKRKQKAIRTRKSLSGPFKKRGSDGEDSEDDFKPTAAAAAKKKAPASKPAPKAATKKTVKDEEEDSDAALPPKPAAKKRVVSGPKKPLKAESDSDSNPKPAAKKGAATKKAKKEESDDEFDSSYEVVKKPAPRKPAVTSMDIESDSDIEVLRTKNKGKGKVSPKRKSPDDEDASDEDSEKKPAKKTKLNGSGQAEVTDFFDKLPTAPAPAPAPAPAKKGIAKSTKASPKRKVSGKKAKEEAEDAEDAEESDLEILKPKKPAGSRKPSGQKPPAKKKKVVESEEEEDEIVDDSDSSVPAPRLPTKRGGGTKKSYADDSLIDFEDDEGDDSMFVD